MAKTADYASIMKDIESGKFAPIYLLYGDESYFIDRITNLLLDRVLTEEEKDFNLTQMYGADITNLGDVVSTCRRYPMMSEYQLVILREAQMLKQNAELTKYEQLEAYTAHPLPSTVFVMTMIGKKPDSRQKWIKQIQEAGGVVFESARIPEYKLKEFLPGFLSATGLQFDDKAIQMLVDFIGSDLSRLTSELEKLKITLTGTRVTADMIASHIGISKEFNSYELVSAVAARDFRKCELIRRYFAQNPRANPIQITISVLFTFFTNVMLAHYAQDKSINGLMREIGLNYPQAKDVSSAMKIYNAWKAMQNIALLRDYDARQKGARGVVVPDDEALQELLYKLMH
ncbi:MAG: DNA polymerase III subunit delta [Bacteroidales bacterium]|nr:DNA polymerase III subunit delta [Bacteroidales bacterium]